MNYLAKIALIADFKTVKNSFIQKGISPIAIDTYLNKFKLAREKNKIGKIEEKNIDYWAKKSWTDFVSFLDEIEKTPTRGEEKKEPWKMNVEGAEKVAENNQWVVFKIKNYEGAKKLGSRNWCVIRNLLSWRNWTEGREGKPTVFYIAFSKTKSYKIKKMGTPIEYEDPWHQVIIGSYDDYQMVWNGHDEERSIYDVQNEELKNLPKVNWEFDEDYCSECERGKQFCNC